MFFLAAGWAAAGLAGRRFSCTQRLHWWGNSVQMSSGKPPSWGSCGRGSLPVPGAQGGPFRNVASGTRVSSRPGCPPSHKEAPGKRRDTIGPRGRWRVFSCPQSYRRREPLTCWTWASPGTLPGSFPAGADRDAPRALGFQTHQLEAESRVPTKHPEDGVSQGQDGFSGCG